MPDALRIPQSSLDDVKRLLALPPDSQEKLIQALIGAPQFAPVSSLVPPLRDALDISNDQAGRLLLAALSAVAQVESPEWPTDRVAAEIIKSDELGLPEEDRPKALKFLMQVMEISAVITSAKASDLLTEHERIFADARIFTDIRPVFMEDPDQLADGVVIVNTLKIQHHESRGVSSYYVSLDTHDLHALKKVVDRALAKIDTVKATLDSADLKYFVEDDEAA